MSILALLVALIVIGLVYWAIVTLMNAFGLPQPIRSVVLVLFVVFVVLWLLSAVGLLNMGPVFRLR